MGKKDAKAFNVGDYVFARVRGFAPWPAKITKRHNPRKFSVYFYGTAEVGNVTNQDLFEYAENKEKYATTKNLKRKFYPEAVEQIEAALRGDDPAPNFSALQDDLNAVNAGVAAAEEAASQSEGELTIDESAAGADLTARDASSVANASAPAVEESPAVVKEEKKPIKTTLSPTPLSQPTEEATAAAAVAAATVKEEEPAVGEETTPTVMVAAPNELEVISRSGRKIKPKRYIDEDIEESIPAQRKKLSASENTTLSSGGGGDVETPAAKKQKKQQDQATKQAQNHLLKLESNLIELDHLIKSTVGLNSAHPEKCLEHLDEYKELQITPLMLKKNPSCVETMKRLRRYVGNAKAWQMDDKVKLEFDEKAQQIRERAESIYNQFKRLFPTGDGKPFWDSFMREVHEFRVRTQHMTPEQIYELVEDPPACEEEENAGSVTENNAKFEV